LLALMCCYTLLWHLGQHRNHNRKLKQASASIVPLGPPSTPPVNLTNSRRTRQSDIDSLLEQRSISETAARPIRLYDTTQRAEFHAAGGAGKLILPQHLDPTSSGFIPGRLLYGPAIPQPSSADKKGKGKQRQSTSRLPDSSPNSNQKSMLSERLGQNSNPPSNRNSQTSVGFSVTIPQKPLPALPVRIMDTAIFSAGPSTYSLPPPQQPSFMRQHHSYSDTWEKPMGTFSSDGESTDILQPPPIPPKHPLRRISSAPPGSLDLCPVPPAPAAGPCGHLRSDIILKPPRLITNLPANWRYTNLPRLDTTRPVVAGPSVPPGIGSTVGIYPPIQTGGGLAVGAIATSVGTATSEPKVGMSPHTPRKSSNLTLSFTPVDLDTSGVDRGYEDQQLSAPNEENSWESGGEEFLHRAGYDFQSSLGSLDLSPVISSDALPQPAVPTSLDSTMATSEEPKIGPVKHQDTFSSEESYESLDPEKMELAEEQAANQQAVTTNLQAKHQEMAEVPESPSLTLSIRGLAHMRSVSSPTPVPIRSPHPVLQLSHGIVTGASPTSQLHPMQSATHTRNRVVSDTSFNNHRYTTVAPLAITKDLPPLPKLPPLKIPTPPPNGSGSSNFAPPTPRSLRARIANLKTQCVGHFTMSPTGQVEMSTQVPVRGASPYRGGVGSASSTHLKADWEGSYSAGQSNSFGLGLEPDARRAQGREGTLEPAQRFPATRKRSKSGPPGTTVRFELSRNEVFGERKWGK